MKSRVLAFSISAVVALGVAITTSAADKKIIFIAGKPSHPPGMHEFRAGCLLLKACLDKVPGASVTVYSNGWPHVDNAFEGADAVVIYADGGGGHPAIKDDHKQVLGDLAKKGVGLGFMHYGVEIPSTNGGPEFLEWIGGYYEHLYSVNPMWSPEFKKFPDHPVARGVKPFSNRDEWYFNMRWRMPSGNVDASVDGAAPTLPSTLTPILVATPSDEVRKGPYVYPKGPYQHIVDATGREETMMWVHERPNGGRGFGFTGGHTHAHWGNDNQRKVVLNALLWIAKAEVPQNGVESTLTADQIKANLDRKGARRETSSAERPSGPEAALSEVSKMAAADGLEVSLFASEPMAVNPADMDVDERGRVWINEGANYRYTFQKWGVLRPGGDRIVILEDTDRDGKADKQTVFYQDMTVNTALGLCVLGNKVIVSSSPYVFVLTDTDGDSKADKRELFFEDTSKGDHDHCVHAFVFGPDGKLYFNFGNEIRELRRPKGGLLSLPLNGPVPAHEWETVVDLAGNRIKTDGKPYRQGMVFRCNLNGSEVESLGWNFRNNYEVAVDSFGTLWQSDNDDDGNRGVRINYVMEFGNFGYTDELTGAGWGKAWEEAKKKGASEDLRPFYHWHQDDPGVVPNLLQTGNGSPTGITVYEGKLLPKIFQGQMIHCDAGPRVVRAYPVSPEGAGYKASTTDVLTSPDSWYRPADVCTGPDGALYIADWHDAVVGGHNMVDRSITNMTGRVYRVAPPGHKPVVAKLDLETPAGCVAALQSPNQATRYLAWTGLNKMQGKAEKELLELWKGPNLRTRARESSRLLPVEGHDTIQRMRARALHLLARIKGKEKKYVEQALQDENPDIRITGLRIARSLKLGVIPYVKRLVKDPSSHVRRECAIALRHNQSPEAPKLWTTLAQQHEGKDRWYLEALGIAADQQEEKFFSAWLEAVGDKWNTPGGRDIVWRSRSTKAPALLAKLATDKNTPDSEKARYIRALDYIRGPEKEAALLEIATSGL